MKTKYRWCPNGCGKKVTIDYNVRNFKCIECGIMFKDIESLEKADEQRCNDD